MTEGELYIIYHTWRISLLCGSGIVNDVTKVTRRIFTSNG